MIPEEVLLEIPEFVELSPVERKRKQKEASVRDALAAAEGGETEITVSSGLIDVLTSSEVIEVKVFNNWKHAIGQARIYYYDYPTKTRRIHLFAEAHQEQAMGKLFQKHGVIDKCNSEDVRVTTAIVSFSD